MLDATGVKIPVGSVVSLNYMEDVVVFGSRVVDGETSVVYDCNGYTETAIVTKAFSIKRSITSDEETNLKKNTPPLATLGGVSYLGTDPEIFVRHGDGGLFPAFEFLPKKGRGVGPQQFYDGFQAEWTTKPSDCLGYLVDQVRFGMRGVLRAAQAKDPTARLVLNPCVDITPEMVQQVDPEHLQLGCEPSMNAYGEERVGVEAPERIPFRSAGCHMHFQLTDVDPSIVPRIVRFLDATLGVMLVSVGQGWNDPRRRELYGRAGEYRFKRTLEYRPPDVAPMLCHPALFNLMWDFGRSAVRLAVMGCDFLWDADPNEVRRVMNYYDVPGAQRIIRENEKVMGRVFEMSYPYLEPNDPITLGVVYDGFQSVVDDPTDLVRNWKLDMEGMEYGRYSVDRDSSSFAHAGGKTNSNWSLNQNIIRQGRKI